MKTYVLVLSKTFPAGHSHAGEETGFKEKFLAAIKKQKGEWMKEHTIRANCELWKKRFKEIEAGNAQLSIRQWSGQPRRSSQVEIARLTREDGIGLQELMFDRNPGLCVIGGAAVSCERISYNDGLSLDSWSEWFGNYDKSKPLAVIHFTEYRY